MRGRLRALDPGYVDSLALAQRRNPHYRENPPGVGNEPIELCIVFGLLDFLLYVFAVYPLAVAFQACFFLWALTIPFGFLSAVMPVGPFSAWYRHRTAQGMPKVEVRSLEDIEQELITRRQRLQELAIETVHVEAELAKELDQAGDLRFALEAQIRQAQKTRSQVNAQIARIDNEIVALRLKSF